MIYKVPCPTNTNGVRLFKQGSQIAVEYTRGVPEVGRMAMDSALGKPARPVTFRSYGRDDLPRGTGMSRSEGQMKPRGSMNINDEDPDEGGGDEVVTKLMSYLNDKLTPEQLSSVAAILGDTDDEDGDTSGEPRDYAQASDRAIDRRRTARLAADAARYRLPTAAEDAAFREMFPGALKIKFR